METAFYLMKKGMSVSKALVEKVYDIVDYFYDCTDIFDDSVSYLWFFRYCTSKNPKRDDKLYFVLLPTQQRL